MHSPIRAWAQLIRVPNTLTACADVIAGTSIAAGAWLHSEGSWQALLPSLVLASCGSICLYWAGMVLNDVNDVEVDRAQRRHGPLVDGRIAVAIAWRAGWTLLLLGVLLASVAAFCIPAPLSYEFAPWLVVAASVALAVCIVAYDSRLKSTPIAPWLMGACRGMNLSTGILLGACVDWPTDSAWLGIAFAIVGHVAFVAGITLAARHEGRLQQSKTRLLQGWSVSLIGVISIAFCTWWADRPMRLDPHFWFPLMVGLLMLPWLRRAINSIHYPGSMTLVLAIKQAILSIIFLDAALTLQFTENLPAIIVCSLAIPTVILSRLFRMT